MTAFTTDMARQLKVCGTKGQITADMNTNTILLHRFGEAKARQIALEAPPQTNNYGHGGGDYFLMQDFVQAAALLRRRSPQSSGTWLRTGSGQLIFS